MTTNNSTLVFHSSAKDFEKIPGAPIAYWVSEALIECFSKGTNLYEIAPTKQGLATGDNDRFLRLWYEVIPNKIAFHCKSSEETQSRMERWYPCNKGGEFRKWYGNLEYIVNWENSGIEIKHYYGENGRLKSRPQNESYYFREGLTWSAIASSLSMRYSNEGTMFETKGAMCFPKANQLTNVLGFLNSKVVTALLQAMAPTLDFHEGPIGKLPYTYCSIGEHAVTCCITIAKTDWDSFETSWDFQRCPLTVTPKEREEQFTYSFNAYARRKSVTMISERYKICRNDWLRDTTEMHNLEEENNRIFIEAYGLQEELTPDVSWNEITLTCNPWYRYGVTPPNPTSREFPIDDDLESRLKTDSVKEFLSYAVGCMFGRYSLDKPGLILANQGEALADYLKQIPQPTFTPDEDNVIPVLGEDWFDDDIVSRFNEFLKATFGEEHFIENLAFIEEALGKDVRSYFTKDFYKEHLQRYHNRPIYWLFSSPKGAFSALIYMHRYRPETVGLVLTYLRSHITKVTQRIHALESTIDSADSTAGMKSKAMRERAKLLKELQELEDYERDVLYPLSTEKIAIDLDDGVKVNYRKFGDALYKIKGLEAKEE